MPSILKGFPSINRDSRCPTWSAVRAAARKHGGSVQNEPVMLDGRLHAAVRDPDGNTIEL
jgi:catechol 2,3-dioxygenase-like lactoylglutathione lyase family enzyme